MAAGIRVGWVGGNTKGRDHFPVRKDSYISGGDPVYQIGGEYLATDAFIDVDNPIGDGTSRPWALGLDTMMEWFSRVRQWECTISGTFSYGVPNSPPDGMFHWATDGVIDITFTYKHPVCVYNYEEGHPDDNGVEASKEYQCVMYRGNCAGVMRDGSVEPQTSVPTNELIFEDIAWTITPNEFELSEVRLEHHLFGGFNDPDFNPVFQWVIQIVKATGSGSDTARTNKLISEDFPPDNTSIGNLEVSTTTDTDDTGIYRDYNGPTDPGFEWQVRLDTVEVLIVPVKYWPFADNARAQVYDEDDGSELTNPFG